MFSFLGTMGHLSRFDCSSGRVSSTNTKSTVLNWFVRNGELSKVVTNHFRIDFNLIESLAIISNDASNHFRNNDHIPQVGSHWLWLLPCRCL
ncbi:hypothetical protein LINPERPRIM_LOCUS21808, partial [Linum perenne]